MGPQFSLDFDDLDLKRSQRAALALSELLAVTPEYAVTTPEPLE